jgi:hypothetical protein
MLGAYVLIVPGPLASWGCQGIPLILAYIILANSDSIIENIISVFTFGL